jgi:hypothetical protein
MSQLPGIALSVGLFLLTSLLVIGLAYLIKRSLPFRFSLKSMFIAFTLAAVGMGLVYSCFR